MPIKTIYQECIEREIPIHHHYSDLYVPYRRETTYLIQKFQIKDVTIFKDQIDGTLWYDVPFAYDPYWEM